MRNGTRKVKQMALGSEKAKRMTSRKRNRYRWIVFFVILIMSIYFTFWLVDLRIQINHASDEYAIMKEKVYAQREKTEDYRRIALAVENQKEAKHDQSKSDPIQKAVYADYVEKIARKDLNYVKNGELVFINIAGH